MVTLDSALRERTPILMKIDVEGYETLVIAGGLETLKAPTMQAVIMELNGSGRRYGFDELKLLQQMVDLGFSTYGYDPFKRQLRTLNGKNNESGNTLFLKDHVLASAKVSAARKFAVQGHSL